jgi:RING-variant domain
MRFGRSIFIVIEMNINKVTYTNTIQNVTEPKEKKPEDVKEEGYVPSCRICLNDISFDENSPLISPCKCSGSVKYIHLECLKKWIASLVKIKENSSVTSYSWKSIKCEICHTPLPKAIYFKKQVIELIDIKRPFSNYVIFEVLDKNTHESKGLQIINANSTPEFRIVNIS